MRRKYSARAREFAHKHPMMLRTAGFVAAGLAGLASAHMAHGGRVEDHIRQYATTPGLAGTAARTHRAERRQDLPGPRSPAFYGHRYSHLLPQGAYEAAMRHGTPTQQAAAGFAP